MDELQIMWGNLLRQVHQDILLINKVWNDAVEGSMPHSPWSNHPNMVLYRYIDSYNDICAQLLLSINMLQQYKDLEPSNITQFYVSKCFYDFIVRLKTGTDLLALIINHVYGLNLPPKRCSLEEGPLPNVLRNIRVADSTSADLARKIDIARQSWLIIFDELRDIVVHRNGVEFIIAGGKTYPFHLQIPLPSNFPFNKPFYYDPKNPSPYLVPYQNGSLLIEFILKLKSASLSDYLTIDTMILCEELWNKYKELSSDLSVNMVPEILVFIKNNK